MKIQANRHVVYLAILMLTSCGIVPARPTQPSPPAGTKSSNEDHSKPEPTPPPPERLIVISGSDSFDRERHADDELLVFAKRFSELSAESQKKELAQINQSLARNKKDLFNRIKAALVYSLPNSKFRDNAKAVGFISELQREKQLEDDISGLLSILKDFVDDRQKLDDNSVKLAQKIKDEQRRADELQQKLDALKNIDKTMIERGQAVPK